MDTKREFTEQKAVPGQQVQRSIIVNSIKVLQFTYKEHSIENR
jgi:hypothetical protein